MKYNAAATAVVARKNPRLVNFSPNINFTVFLTAYDFTAAAGRRDGDDRAARYP